MKKEVLILSAAIFLAGTSAVRAQSCATPPSCASLGYTMTTDDCSGQPTLVCPFDSSAVFCAGSSSGSGSSSGGGGSSEMPSGCTASTCFKHHGRWYQYKVNGTGVNVSTCQINCRSLGMYVPADKDEALYFTVSAATGLSSFRVAAIHECESCIGEQTVFSSISSAYSTGAHNCVCIREM